jgi:hypothetical protein
MAQTTTSHTDSKQKAPTGSPGGGGVINQQCTATHTESQSCACHRRLVGDVGWLLGCDGLSVVPTSCCNERLWSQRMSGSSLQVRACGLTGEWPLMHRYSCFSTRIDALNQLQQHSQQCPSLNPMSLSPPETPPREPRYLSNCICKLFCVSAYSGFHRSSRSSALSAI